MTLTSEVDNILNGQVIRKSNNDKAIGVSTANLIPDEKGVAPLSKQTAFVVATQTVEQTVTTDIQNPQVAPETVPAAQTQGPSLVNQAPESSLEQVNQTAEVNNVVEEPQISALNALESTTQGEELESITYNSPQGILTDSPVSVTAPDSLESFGFGEKKEEAAAPAVVETKTEEVQQEAVELPPMPDQILAQEPTGINSSLFVGSEGEAVNQTAPVENTVVSEQPVQAQNTLLGETEVAPIINETQDTNVVLDNPVAEQTPVVADVSNQKGPETTIVSETVVDSPFTVPAENSTLESAPVSQENVVQTEETPQVTTELATEEIPSINPLSVPANDTPASEVTAPQTEEISQVTTELDTKEIPSIDPLSVPANDTPVIEEKVEESNNTELDIPTPISESQSAPESLFEKELDESKGVADSNIEEKLDMVISLLTEIKQYYKGKRSEDVKTDNVEPQLATIETGLNELSETENIPSTSENVVENNEQEVSELNNLGLPTLEESLGSVIPQPSVNESAPAQTPLAENTPVGNTNLEVNDEQIVGARGYFV